MGKSRIFLKYFHREQLAIKEENLNSKILLCQRGMWDDGKYGSEFALLCVTSVERVVQKVDLVLQSNACLDDI